METLTLEQAQAEEQGNRGPLRKLLRLHGMRVTDGSYAVKALEALPRMGGVFTVSQLSRAAGIPRSKGYPTVRRLEELGLVEALPGLRRPDDWGEYTLGMRKRFYRDHGLPPRGKEPRRFRYRPRRALEHLRDGVMREIATVDTEAQKRIAVLLGALDEAEGLLRRHEGAAPDE